MLCQFRIGIILRETKNKIRNRYVVKQTMNALCYYRDHTIFHCDIALWTNKYLWVTYSCGNMFNNKLYGFQSASIFNAAVSLNIYVAMAWEIIFAIYLNLKYIQNTHNTFIGRMPCILFI